MLQRFKEAEENVSNLQNFMFSVDLDPSFLIKA